jgi:hypothetical protein
MSDFSVSHLKRESAQRKSLKIQILAVTGENILDKVFEEAGMG